MNFPFPGKCAITVLCILASCQSKSVREDVSSKVFRYNESKGVNSLDPAYARDQSSIWPVSQIFNGLLQMDPDLNIKPSLAKSYSISGDGTLYRFVIDTSVKFHDHECFPGGQGRNLTARDFVFSFNRILNPSTASPGKWVFNQVDTKNSMVPGGFKAENDSILIICLKQAFPPFAGILTMPYCYVVPEEAVNYYGPDFGQNPVGTGPFRFKLWKQDEKLILLRNSCYFEKDESGNSLPYLEGIAISFIRDKQSEFLEFLAGKLDFLSGVHTSYKDEILTFSGTLKKSYSGRFHLATGPYLNTEYLGILADTANPVMKNNPLTHKKVRQAINCGFDRNKMMLYMRNNLGIPADKGMVPYGMRNFNHELVDGYVFNPEKAKKLLTDQGFPGGEGLGEILLTTTSDYLDLCEFIQHELAFLGIKIKLEVATGAGFRNKVANGGLAFFRGSWIADYPDPENYLSLFYSGNMSPDGPNYTRFRSARFDSLYIRAAKCQDEQYRVQVYAQMEQEVIDSSYIIPLYYDRLVRIVSNQVKNFEINPMNMLIIKNIKKI